MGVPAAASLVTVALLGTLDVVLLEELGDSRLPLLAVQDGDITARLRKDAGVVPVVVVLGTALAPRGAQPLILVVAMHPLRSRQILLEPSDLALCLLERQQLSLTAAEVRLVRESLPQRLPDRVLRAMLPVGLVDVILDIRRLSPWQRALRPPPRRGIAWSTGHPSGRAGSLPLRATYCEPRAGI